MRKNIIWILDKNERCKVKCLRWDTGVLINNMSFGVWLTRLPRTNARNLVADKVYGTDFSDLGTIRDDKILLTPHTAYAYLARL